MNESQYQGTVLGLAVGDALGYPAEFMSRQQIQKMFGTDGITDFVKLPESEFDSEVFSNSLELSGHPPGTFTDDTQMSIAVAEALLESQSHDVDTVMSAVARRFVEWSRSEDNDRAPGDTCMQGCANLAKGTHWSGAGVSDSKGCGSAMRVSPIGLFYEDLDKVREIARASSLLTHGHDAAVAGAEAAAMMVALALRGLAPAGIFDEVAKTCGPSSQEFAQVWQKVPEVLHLPPEQVLVDQVLGESWVADEAVASAMYCFWKHPDDFCAAVLMAINTDGDSDSIGAITGSIVGARLGLEAIPTAWCRQVEASKYLHELGTRLWNGRRKSDR